MPTSVQTQRKETEPKVQPKVLRMNGLVTYTGLSRSFIYRLIQRGQFPKQIQLTPASVAWRVSDIDEWLDSRQTANNPDPLKPVQPDEEAESFVNEVLHNKPISVNQLYMLATERGIPVKSIQALKGVSYRTYRASPHGDLLAKLLTQ